MMAPDGRVFLKSEAGLIGNDWPCLSFTKRSVGDYLRREFVSGRDVIIYVGTTGAEMTRNPDHRSRLLAALDIEPSQPYETRKIIPEKVWKETVAEWGELWTNAMIIRNAANMVGPPFPSAHEIVPKAYRSFASMANRGRIVEALDEERAAVMELEVERVELELGQQALDYLELRKSLSADVPKLVSQEAYRMASLIIERVKNGGKEEIKVNPMRIAPPLSDLNALLIRKWGEQGGLCALCGGAMQAGATNKMLQPSADRIDSGNPAYDDANVGITHLACNLGKNKWGREEFEDWLEVIRGNQVEVN